MPDALYNALKTVGYDEASLKKIRSAAMPKLGNDPMASWKDLVDAMTKQYQ